MGRSAYKPVSNEFRILSYYLTMGVGRNFSQCAVWTTSANCERAVFKSISFATDASANKSIKVIIESRRNGGVWLQTSTIPIVQGVSRFDLEGSGFYLPKTDIRIRAQAAQSNTQLQVFYVLECKLT